MPKKSQEICKKSNTPLAYGKSASKYIGKKEVGCDGKMYKPIKWGSGYRWQQVSDSKKDPIVLKKTSNTKTKHVLQKTTTKPPVHKYKPTKTNGTFDAADIVAKMTLSQIKDIIFLDNVEVALKKNHNHRKIVHQAHSSSGALKTLLDLIRSSEETNLCHGLQGSWWLKALIITQNFHPKICTTKGLKLKVDDENDIFLIHNPEVLKQCKKNNNVSIVPLSINFLKGCHANMMLIDKKKKRIEFFEPNGSKDYHPILDYFDNKIKSEMKNLGYKEYEIISAYDSCDIRVGPQAIVEMVHCNFEGGYCATFAHIYAHLRLLSPDCSPSETIRSFATLSPEEMISMCRKYITWQLSLCTKEYRELYNAIWQRISAEDLAESVEDQKSDL